MLIPARLMIRIATVDDAADFTGMTFVEWRRLIWDAPDRDPALSVIASEGDRVVGSSFVIADRERVARRTQARLASVRAVAAASLCA